MKKLIFTTLSMMAVGAAFAQKPMIDNSNDPKFRAANQVLSPAQKATKGSNKNVISDWYSPLDWAEGAGAVNTGYVQFVMPDSLCKYIDKDDTIRRPYNISFGQIIDPKDDNIDLSANPGIKMTKYTGYSVDSIGLVYLYVRNVDMQDDGSGNMVDVVDTLIISYFSIPNAGITKNTLVGSGELVAYPSWSVANLMPTKMIASQKIPLTRDDSTTARNNNGGFENAWGLKSKNYAAPAGVVNIAKGGSIDNIVGYTISFKLGHKYDSNNVMIYQKDPVAFPLTNPRANYYGYSLSITEGDPTVQIQQTKFYTNSLMVNKTSAYNTGSGWVGYVPGNAYFETQYVQTDAFLSSVNSGIKNINNETFAMSNVYPNPAQVNGTAVMAFNLKTAATVNVSIYNIAGQLVKTAINGNFAAGERAEEISLAGLKAGIYMVNMTVNGASVTKKLTITE